MRTQVRDALVYETGATVADALAGVGVMQPGSIPFAFIRSATGQYNFQIDARITPLSGGSTMVSGPFISLIPVMSAGTFRVDCYSSGFALTNGTFRFTLNVKDAR